MAEPEIRGHQTFRNAFSDLAEIYEAIGQVQPQAPRRKIRLSDDEALRRLSDLFQRCGHLNYELINEQPDLPHATTYAARFGGLAKAYARVGYVQLTAKELKSPVGRARLAALKLRRVGASDPDEVGL